MPPLPSTLTSSQLSRFPKMTAIVQDYIQRDDRWIIDRVIPVFRTDDDRPSATVWPAISALPTNEERMSRASGGIGAEIGMEAPGYVDFQVTENQLTSTVLDREVAKAPANDPDRAFKRRAKRAAGFLKLENELRGMEFFTPTNAKWAGGATNPIGDSGASQILDPGHDWLTYNPLTDDFISLDNAAGISLFKKLNGGTPPNFRIIDDVSDAVMVRKLARERNAGVILSGSSTDYVDLFPSAANKVLGGALTLVPGAITATTPADASYNPKYAWGDFPWMVFGYSPTLDGSLWDESGEAYAANAEFVVDGENSYETYKQRDPIERNKRTFMWWDYNRQIKVLKPTLVVAVRVRPDAV